MALIAPNEATPATPGSGSTEVFVNTSKQLAMVNDAGLVTIVDPNGCVAYQATPADPTGTTNTTGLMMGLAGAITPAVNGRVLIIISGDIQSTLSGDGGKLQIRYGTGTAPVNAAALTGTAIGGLVNMLAAANNQRVPFTCQAIVTALTVATAYWIDVGLAAVTGGTAAIKNVSISANEF